MTDESKFSNSAEAQRKRLIEALALAEGKGITSHYAIQELGVYYPPARIKELREMGYNIVTLWETIETDISRPRRVARYVLISGARDQAA